MRWSTKSRGYIGVGYVIKAIILLIWEITTPEQGRFVLLLSLGDFFVLNVLCVCILG